MATGGVRDPDYRADRVVAGQRTGIFGRSWHGVARTERSNDDHGNTPGREGLGNRALDHRIGGDESDSFYLSVGDPAQTKGPATGQEAERATTHGAHLSILLRA